MRKNLVRLAPQPKPDPGAYAWATVTDDSPLRIQLDGADDPLGFSPDSLVGGLQVDDRVWVQLVTNANPSFKARRAVILGKSGGSFNLDAVYPVGSIHLSISSTNPGTLIGGTWVAWGQGRFPVSHNTSGTFNVAAETTGGAETHTLSTANLASHSHGVGTLAMDSQGNHTHSIARDHDGAGGSSEYVLHSTGITSGYDELYNNSLTSAGSHSHTISGSTASAGSGSAVNHLPPYIVCYMWKRTA